MNRLLKQGVKNKLLAATITVVVLLPATSAYAWRGPVGLYAGGWDPHEAHLNEYGFLDRYGPTRGDIQRMHRDNWMAMRGYPSHRRGIGPYGPTLSDIRRQHHRKGRRFRGYPYW